MIHVAPSKIDFWKVKVIKTYQKLEDQTEFIDQNYVYKSAQITRQGAQISRNLVKTRLFLIKR